jgi:hypothetical protein
MFFQERVNDGSEQLIPAGRRNYFLPCKFCPDLCAVFILGHINGQWAGFFAHLILDPFCFSLVHNGHKRIDTVQAAGKPTIGIHLYEDFLDFIHRQAGIQAFV